MSVCLYVCMYVCMYVFVDVSAYPDGAVADIFLYPGGPYQHTDRE